MCPGCGGLWCEAAEWLASEIGLGQELRSTGDSRHSCPKCHRDLHVEMVTAVDGLAIDHCVACGGFWFDHREWEYLGALRDLRLHERRLAVPTTWSQWTFQLLTQLPVEFNVPPRRRPWGTIGLIVLCMGMFALQFASPDGLAGFGLKRDGLLSPMWMATLVTHQFLHVNLIHLLGNMYFLWVAGDNVEDAMGREGFLGFFLLSGVLAALGQLMLVQPDPTVVLVGASGAISAVMGAYVVLFRMAKLTFFLVFVQRKISAGAWLGMWVCFNVAGVVLHLDPSVAFTAHLSGFAVGVVVALACRRHLLDTHPLLQLYHSNGIRPTGSPGT